MVVSHKNHQKLSDVKYKKILNKKDPFDQLILELSQKGVLDVSAVGIGSEQPLDELDEYSRRPVHRGKHSS